MALATQELCEVSLDVLLLSHLADCARRRSAELVFYPPDHALHRSVANFTLHRRCADISLSFYFLTCVFLALETSFVVYQPFVITRGLRIPIVRCRVSGTTMAADSDDIILCEANYRVWLTDGTNS